MAEDMMSVVSKLMPGHLKRSGGNNVLTICPFHKGGNEKRASFSINLDSGVFHCFTGGCPAGSGSFKKLLELLQLPPTKINEVLNTVKPFLDQVRRTTELRKVTAFKGVDPFRCQYPLTEAIQGVYDFCPVSLLEKGFSQEVMREMGVGYDLKNNRIMYPIHDMYGALAGYSGGVTSLTTNFLYQKYRVYEGKYQSGNGQWCQSDYGEWFDDWFRQEYGVSSSEYHLKNHNYLWNFHRVWGRRTTAPETVPVIYVVEGFKACLWMIQSGYANTVALMGSYVSEKQQQMLHKTGCEIALFLDNDKAGISATSKVGKQLFSPMYGRVSVVQYPSGDSDTQPDSYSAEQVKQMVEGRIPLNNHLTRGHANVHF